ncbi:A-factor biosynthesis repeat-containing protein [Actinobacteria bacterium OK074]|nr:A-factor biosynthesis repeat-containing protein [Actinobacteria bacterium OK074]
MTHSALAQLSWDHTVPRHLVHRRSVAEVLLTDARRLADDRFLVAAQWPLRHSDFHRDPDGRHDPVFAAETIRQIGLLVPRTFLGVPEDAVVVIRTVGFRLDAEVEPRALHGASDILCDVEVHGIRHTRRVTWPAALNMRVTFSAAGRTFGTAEGRLRALTATEYAAVRGGCPPVADAAVRGAVVGAVAGGALAEGAVKRPSPAEVGVAGPGGVMLRYGAAGALYVDPADRGHPLFFDHPSDHISGMVLLEAVRQAACLARGTGPARPASCRFAADRFTEWDRPALVECATTEGAWDCRIVQDGAVTATGRLRFHAPV